MKTRGAGSFGAAAMLVIATLLTVSSSYAEGEAFNAATSAYRAAAAKEVREGNAEAGVAFDRASEADLAGRGGW